MDAKQFLRDLTDGKLSRRDVMTALSAVGVASVSVPMLRRPALADGDLTVFTWSGYELPEFYTAYTEKYGTDPAFSFYADNDEAFATALLEETGVALLPGSDFGRPANELSARLAGVDCKHTHHKFPEARPREVWAVQSASDELWLLAVHHLSSHVVLDDVVQVFDPRRMPWRLRFDRRRCALSSINRR